MKVSVLGAGAIGSMLGGLIQHHAPQWNVVLIARGEHGQAMCRRGMVRLEGPWGIREVPIRASEGLADLAGSDCVLVTVKSQDLEAALCAASPYLGESLVASIQNGINDEVVSRFVAPSRLVMGMTATNMAIVEPGGVRLQLDGVTVVGASPDRTNAAAARAVAELLEATSLAVIEHPNVLGVRYNKLAINALGYASCISNSNFITEAVCFGPWRKAVGRPIVEECMAVFHRAGIGLAKIPRRPDVNGLARFLRLLDVPLVGTAVAAGARRLYNRKPIVFSLAQDLRRGKTTEVDYINGRIVQVAEDHGLAAPCNALVVELVHRLQQRGSAGFMPREEVIRRFRQPGASKETASGA